MDGFIYVAGIYFSVSNAKYLIRDLLKSEEKAIGLRILIVGKGH